MKADLVVEAFVTLYPEKPFNFTPVLKYSGKFKGFNANIKVRNSVMTLSLAKQWRTVSKDIQIGCIQDLIGRVMKQRKSTSNIELYHAFLRNVHVAVPKTKTDPILRACFDKINNAFFNGMMEAPNFEWMDGRRTVGQYDYGADLIRISQHLAKDPEAMAYVMYHEMLHKKHKFNSSPGRKCHHSAAFREDEAKFPNAAQLERRLSGVGRGSSGVLAWFGF